MADDSGTPEGAPEGHAPTIDQGLREEILQQLEAAETGEASTENEPTAPAVFTFADGTEVPIEEVEKGWLRQQDYTRKTQEASELRKEAEQALRLMQALADSPVETLEALQRNLLADNEDDNLDPLEAQLRQHEERFTQLEQERFDQELNSALTTLEGQYADRGFDRDAVLEWAVTHEIQNLEAAFLHMENARAQDAVRNQRNQEALDRKRSVPPLGGRSRSLGGDMPEFVEVKTVADAMKNALAELESQS
jgi:hypothetical protein